MIHHRTLLAAALALGSLTSSVLAQPDPTEKGDAKSLLSSGLKLYAAKDYLGALAVFRNAYDRFPSGKILLNIGTTLLKLDRKAEAANAYQGYIDAPDVDDARKVEAQKVLTELDRDLGLLELDITPADAEVQIGDSDWMPAATAKRYRVTKGDAVVRARRDGYVAGEEKLAITAGERKTVALALAPEPVATTTTTGSVGGGGGGEIEGGVRGGVVTERPRSRIGGVVLAHIDPSNSGAAVRLGVVFDATSQLSVQGAALVGPTSGAYLGASYAITETRVRPIVSVGAPLFFSDGPRIAVRAAGGVEIAFGRHLSLIAELGVERMLNAEDGVSATLFIPAIGAAGRL